MSASKKLPLSVIIYMAAIHDLEKQIHASYDVGLFTGGYWRDQIAGLGVYPTGQASLPIYIKVVREYNRKLWNFGYSGLIDGTYDAGFRPLDDNLLDNQDPIQEFLDNYVVMSGEYVTYSGEYVTYDL
jgi:hypothetical protein